MGSDPRTDDGLDRCAGCGRPLADNVRHPVGTRHEDDALRLYAFCDESCRQAWREGRPGS